MVLSFLVDKQIITRVDKEKVVRDSMNYLYANFEFSPDWTGQKTAVFKSKSGAFNVLLDDDGKCLVPWEVLQDEVIEISVFCGALITANVVKIITLASGYTIGEEGREPTPDVYTQIMEKLSEIEAEVDPESLQALIDAYLADKDYVTEADVETIVAAYVDAHKSEWQGSEVEVTQTLQSGTKIAEISVDGTTTNLYAPAGGGGATALDDLTDVSLTTPQSGDVLVYDGQKWGNAVFDGFERVKAYTLLEPTYKSGYVNRSNGSISSSSGANYCEIDVTPGETYRIVSTHSYSIGVYVFYKADGTFISGWPTTNYTETKVSGVDAIVPENAALMRCSGYSSYLLKIYKVTDSDNYEVVNKKDVLYGKKWLACGDSFTAGSFNGYVDSQGNTGQESDAFDSVAGEWKTYPYWIKQRTGIVYDNSTCALSGADFTNISGATTPFSVASSVHGYKSIPNDCDYITLMFGLNESTLTAEQIGTSEDTTNETLWGAYSVVLTDILTNNPDVKIGIIIEDAWLSQTYHDALIDIAKYWGIPYLDLRNGEEVPMMIGGKLDESSSTAAYYRNEAFAISLSNSHPNPKGHQYRSTVIENFLRSL